MITRFSKWLALTVVLAACDSPLDTNPTTAVETDEALRTGEDIRVAVNGAYAALQSGSLYSRQEVVYPDLYADNLDFTGTFQTDREYALRSVTTLNGSNQGTWQAAYRAIGRANHIIEAIPNIVSNASEVDTARARGEAMFIRALSYSILARWFGGVPIVTDPTKVLDDKASLPRNTLAQVYAFIEAELEAALPMLPTGRSSGRATQGAVNALLARVYLEDGKYAQARDKATLLINNTATYRLVTNYRDLFTIKHTTESIFELNYAGGNDTNALAFWFFDQSFGGRRGFQPNLAFFNAFEANDTRRAASITTQRNRRIGFKYHRISTQDDNVHVLRLAEMYLIRAEANMRLGAAPATVRADIDVVRARAGLLPLLLTVDTESELIDAILQERRVEFAMEGHRFFDLRRLGRATTVLAIPAERLLLPVPQQERDVNPSLTQNPGY